MRADLHDPLAMPPELLKAHRCLDRAVDVAYGKAIFASEAERVAFLFERYRQLKSLLPEQGSTMSTGSANHADSAGDADVRRDESNHVFR